jgi:hypothetical protein
MGARSRPHNHHQHMSECSKARGPSLARIIRARRRVVGKKTADSQRTMVRRRHITCRNSEDHITCLESNAESSRDRYMCRPTTSRVALNCVGTADVPMREESPGMGGQRVFSRKIAIRSKLAKSCSTDHGIEKLLMLVLHYILGLSYRTPWIPC